MPKVTAHATMPASTPIVPCPGCGGRHTNHQWLPSGLYHYRCLVCDTVHGLEPLRKPSTPDGVTAPETGEWWS